MLDLLGAEYIVRHCLTIYNQRKREQAFWVYVTDCVAVVAKYTGAKINKRFYDILNPPPEEQESAEDIVSKLARKMGLKEVREDGECVKPDGDAGT